MRARWKTIAALAVSTVCIVYIVYAFIVPPEWARTPAGPELGTACDITTHASEANPQDFRVSFRHPSAWKVEEHQHPKADMVLSILPPEGRTSRTNIALVVTREPALLATPKPIIPPGATVHRKSDLTLGGKPAAFVEISSTAPNNAYSRAMSWQATIDGRHVALAGTATGNPHESADVDRRFEEYRATFEAVAKSLKFETTTPK